MTFYPDHIYRVTKDGHYISANEKILVLNPKEYQKDNGERVIMNMENHPRIFISIAIERAKLKG